MKWKRRAIVAFDTETTGLQPFAGDRIIEFAAVVLRLDDSGQIVDREDHSFLVNPGIPIPRKVTEITGISDGDVVEAPSFEAVADDVQALLRDSVSVAHNYPFDLAFLTKEFQRIGRSWPEPMAEIDTVDLSLRCFPDARSHRLADVCSRVGVVLDGAHRATNDAAACGEVFAALVRRFDVDDDLQAMLDWAGAIGRPPEIGPIGLDEDARPVFVEGPHQGSPVAEHPIHLAWLEKARERGPNGWRFRFPQSTRSWVRRWLEVRGAGRAKQNPKSFHAEDWVLDSCIASRRITS